MLTALNLILATGLLAVMVHDLKSRLIPLYLLVIVLLLGGIRLFFLENAALQLQYLLINTLATLMLLGMALLVLFIRKRSLFNPFNTLIGTGDLLLFPLLCLLFSPLNFLLFFIGSCLLLLLYAVLGGSSKTNLPMAGIQSALLATLLIVAEISPIELEQDINLYSNLPI